MTTPRYPLGCAEKSQVSGIASPSDYAWNVNLNDGNSNRNHQSNHNHVRAVRASECPATFPSLHSAWRRTRRGKRPSPDQLTFDSYWIDNLFALQARINSLTWEPGKPTCFIATQPKAREIHAPPFADRVVHHWLVPQLEAIYERTFIHDSYSNRVGKGTHAAVDRLNGFIRQVHSGQGGGWYLQLDIANFFNSINRPILYAMLKKRMERHGIPLVARRAAHALLRRSPVADGVNFIGSEVERARVPAHKRLENAAVGCGLAIGNLSSQFFANVYLNELDQFVKHELKAERYLRYVDDFVLVHRDRGQLRDWQLKVRDFLRGRLSLELKADIKLKPLVAGCDFLGYVVYPTHAVVRRRVISHARAKLNAWERRHIEGRRIRASRGELEGLRSVWASYEGHFRHARHHKLIRRLHQEYPWLQPSISMPKGPLA
jgi:hypothetical protein